MYLSKKDITAIIKCIDISKEVSDSTKGQEFLDSLRTKVEMYDTDLDITINDKLIDTSNRCIDNLKELVKIYSNPSEMVGIHELEQLKREMSGQLEFLGTLRESIGKQVSKFDEYVNKELKEKVTVRITSEKGISVTQARKAVDADERYVNAKRNYWQCESHYNYVKLKYDFFMKLWQMVHQSVSVAGKEQFVSKNT